MVHARLIPLVFVVGCSGTPAAPADAGNDSPQLADAGDDSEASMTSNCGSCPGACYQNFCAKRLFTSSRTYDGATVQSTVHADDECGAMAKAAGLSGHWQAWISDELGSSPATRFGAPYPGPYVLAKSTNIRIVKTADDFSKGLEHAIDQDENGMTVGGFVWTQTDQYGDVIPTGVVSGDACASWTSTAPTGNAMCGTITKLGWSLGNAHHCDESGHMYCFEQ